MRTKVSLLLLIIGIIIAAFSLTMSGQGKMTTLVLGLIIACGGCVMILFKDQFIRGHRGFTIITTALFVVLIVAYVFKILH